MSTFRIYFVVAGHLKLTLTSGSTTRYQGAFVDYVGNTSTKASADASNAAAPGPQAREQERQVHLQDGPAVRQQLLQRRGDEQAVQLKVSMSQITLGAAPHVTKTASCSIVLSERSGGINDPIEYAGTLTIAYDADGRISGGQVTVTNSKGKNVTHALKSSGCCSSSCFYTVAQVDKKYFGLTATISGTSLNGYGFGADGSKTAQWIVSGTA